MCHLVRDKILRCLPFSYHCSHFYILIPLQSFPYSYHSSTHTTSAVYTHSTRAISLLIHVPLQPNLYSYHCRSFHIGFIKHSSLTIHAYWPQYDHSEDQVLGPSDIFNTCYYPYADALWTECISHLVSIHHVVYHWNSGSWTCVGDWLHVAPPIMNHNVWTFVKQTGSGVTWGQV